MQHNLSVFEHLGNCDSILIAGADGDFDIFAGLPIYFTLRDTGKTIHLANNSFTESVIAKPSARIQKKLQSCCWKVQGSLKVPFMYYPEGYLAEQLYNTNNG
ncbi:MAG: hypothetical protein ACPG7F_01475 [Aggregatilineales bacterium]